MDSLNEHKVYQIHQGRVLEDGEMVKDIIGVGLQHLSGNSTTNPIQDFNKAFQGLQKRRLMKPVSELVKEQLTSSPVSPTLASTTPAPIHVQPSDPVTSDPALEGDKAPVQGNQINEDSGPVEELPSELDEILEDLVQGEVEPTLACTTLDDVALDMDTVEPVDELSDGSDETDWETEEAEMSE